ncbi:MAG: hypothetical protein GF398_02720 [Chitinivibrionales bacterium]|nr:hypothetical protein [Chitinivibrionales bacterium]
MSKYAIKLFGGLTDEGDEFAGGVLLRPSSVYRADEIVNSLKILELSGLTDPFDIDYELARIVREAFGTDAVGIALTIHVPEVNQQCGGIIGSAQTRPESAGAHMLCERIDEEFVCAAWPAGPGVIISGSETDARKCLETVNPGVSGRGACVSLIGYSHRAGFRHALVVCDGTGSHARGCVASLTKGNMHVKCLAPVAGHDLSYRRQ